MAKKMMAVFFAGVFLLCFFTANSLLAKQSGQKGNSGHSGKAMHGDMKSKTDGYPEKAGKEYEKTSGDSEDAMEMKAKEASGRHGEQERKMEQETKRYREHLENGEHLEKNPKNEKAKSKSKDPSGEELNRGLEKQSEKKMEQEQKELDKGSEQGQESRENRQKWYKF